MDEAVQDAVFAEIVRRLLRMRIELTRVDFDELASAMLLDLDVAEIEAEGRKRPRKPPTSESQRSPLCATRSDADTPSEARGNVIPFKLPEAARPRIDEA